MPASICQTCGSQFAPAETPPPACPICSDERQYVGWSGQRWTTLAALRQSYQADIRPVEPGLTGIGTQPSLAIGQRALLVETAAGNVLWDCIGLLDDAIIAAVNRLGGLTAIAISHPHFYTTMVEWAQVFGATIYLHAADRQWVMRPDPSITFWEGETYALGADLTLIRGGGHFAGGTVLHWAAGADGRGALLTGDIFQVVADRRYVSFMYSYPNLIPLSPRAVRRLVAAVAAHPFDRLYGGWWERVIATGAQAAVAASAQRYIAALTDSA